MLSLNVGTQFLFSMGEKEMKWKQKRNNGKFRIEKKRKKKQKLIKTRLEQEKPLRKAVCIYQDSEDLVKTRPSTNVIMNWYSPEANYCRLIILSAHASTKNCLVLIWSSQLGVWQETERYLLWRSLSLRAQHIAL